MAGRVAAAGHSCSTVAFCSLEELSIPRTTPVSPRVGCAHPLRTPVILCAQQLLALAPLSLGMLPLGPCTSLLAQCRTSPCRQTAATSDVTSSSVVPTGRPRAVVCGEVLCSLLSTCVEEQL